MTNHEDTKTISGRDDFGITYGDLRKAFESSAPIEERIEMIAGLLAIEFEAFETIGYENGVLDGAGVPLPPSASGCSAPGVPMLRQ